MAKNPHIGSTVQSLFEELGEWDEVQARAQKKIIATRLRKRMEERNVTKTQLAKMLKTSQSQLDTILNPNDPGLTLITLCRACLALGLRPKIELREAKAS